MMHNYNKKIGKIFFIVVSLAILGLGFLMPESNVSTILIGVVTFVALTIFEIYIPQITGLSSENPKIKTMKRLNHATMVLIVICFGVIEWIPSVKNYIMENEGMSGMILAAAIMAVIGNAAPKIPFNRYMGLRLPWTIRDEVAWKTAHKLLGYLTFPIVLLMVIGSFYIDPKEMIKYCVLSWFLIPAVYSGWVYYQRLSGKK